MDKNLISEYNISKTSVKGDTGDVFKATRVCALKKIDLINVPIEKRNQMIKDWQEEVKNLARVRDHENVVQYRNAFVTDKMVLYIEMDYCDGGTFNDYILQKQPDKELKRQFMLEIANAVSFLHGNKILHRDLTPENIMIKYDPGDKHPNVKVGDFGLSTSLAESSSAASQSQANVVACGSVRKFFMAPELFAESPYTAGSDIFSMGVIFFAMIPDINQIKLTDRKTILTRAEKNSEPLGEYMHNNQGKEGYLAPGFSQAETQIGESISSLINKMLKFDVNDRPTAEDVADKLNNINAKDLCRTIPPPNVHDDD